MTSLVVIALVVIRALQPAPADINLASSPGNAAAVSTGQAVIAGNPQTSPAAPVPEAPAAVREAVQVTLEEVEEVQELLAEDAAGQDTIPGDLAENNEGPEVAALVSQTAQSPQLQPVVQEAGIGESLSEGDARLQASQEGTALDAESAETIVGERPGQISESAAEEAVTIETGLAPATVADIGEPVRALAEEADSRNTVAETVNEITPPVSAQAVQASEVSLPGAPVAVLPSGLTEMRMNPTAAWLSSLDGQSGYTIQLFSVPSTSPEGLEEYLQFLQLASLLDETYICFMPISSQSSGRWQVMHKEFGGVTPARNFIGELPAYVQQYGPYVRNLNGIQCSYPVQTGN